jgi:hypothetical protein
VLAVVTASAAGDFDSMADVLDGFGVLDAATTGAIGLAWLSIHLAAQATGEPVASVLQAVGHQLTIIEARLGGTVGSGG